MGLKLDKITNPEWKRRIAAIRQATPRRPAPAQPDPYRGFCRWCEQMGIPAPTREHKFYDGRGWKLDFAWIEQGVYLEVEGGIWTGGRHTRGGGYLRDIEKYNFAALMGWLPLRCTPKTLETIETANMIRAALLQRGWQP